MMVNLIIAVIFILYMVFTGATIWLTAISSKPNPRTTLVGRIVYYHGLSWMIGMIAVAVLTLSMIAAKVILLYLQGIH